MIRADPRQFDLFVFASPPPARPMPARELHVPAWAGLAAWIAEIERQTGLMRCATPHYRRFDATARQLTAARIRTVVDRGGLDQLASWLARARAGGSGALHWLDRVWTRAELGVLIVEVGNRRQLLAMGRLAPKEKGPRFDVTRLPDDRLEALIQRHPDMTMVEACRAERIRRQAGKADPVAPIAATPARARPAVVAAIRELIRDQANAYATDDRRRFTYQLGAGAMLVSGYARGVENEPKYLQRDFLAGAGAALSALFAVDHADEGFNPLGYAHQPAAPTAPTPAR